MTQVSIIGIDPGLVHTGVVMTTFDEISRSISKASHTIEGKKHPLQVRQLLEGYGFLSPREQTHIFIETYRERGNVYATDDRMRKLVQRFAETLPTAVLVDNTGSRHIVKPALLKLLGLDEFPTTHHQDLQAAARILVYGALKTLELNALLSQVVQDHLDGNTWTVLD